MDHQITKKHPLGEPLTFRQRKFLLHFFECGFNIEQACDKMKLSRNRVYHWMRESTEFNLAMNHVKDMLIHSAEAAIAKAIQEGNVQAAIFVLKTIGKKKGYTESIDITSNGQTVMPAIIQIISPDQPKQIEDVEYEEPEDDTV